MHKKILFAVIIISLFAACKSSKGHCDAYGMNDMPEEDFDIHSHHTKSMEKYLTITHIK